MAASTESLSDGLSSEPVIIEPDGGSSIFDWHELWKYRELLYFLSWRDVKVRYKQTIFGVLWVVMQPLLLTVIFSVFLGSLIRVPSAAGTRYAIFAYCGLMLWTFFSGAISVGSNALIANANLITKVYFPRVIIPCAVIGGRLIDLAISFILLIGMMVYYGAHFSLSILLTPIFLILLILFALGFSLLTCALTVKYRDIGLALPVLIQLWMFVSPIIYPLELVPQRWQKLYALNPLVGIIDGFRACLLNYPVSWWAVIVSGITTFVLLVYAARVFRRTEKSFADVI